MKKYAAFWLRISVKTYLTKNLYQQNVQREFLTVE